MLRFRNKAAPRDEMKTTLTKEYEHAPFQKQGRSAMGLGKMGFSSPPFVSYRVLERNASMELQRTTKWPPYTKEINDHCMVGYDRKMHAYCVTDSLAAIASPRPW